MGKNRSNKISNLCLAGILAVAGFFSFYELTESPSFWYDEGWYFQISANIASIGQDGLQFAPGDIRHIAITTVGYPLLYPMAMWMKVFGSTVFVARFLMAIFILGFLTAVFFFVRRISGVKIALAATLLLALFPPLYGNGKSVLGEVPGMLFLVLSLLSLQAAVAGETRRRFFLVLSGFFLGLCITTKPIFLPFLVAFAIGVALFLKKKEMSWRNVSVLSLSAILPITAWLFIQFGPSDSALNILGYYTNPYYKTDILGTVLINIKNLLTSSSGIYTLFLAVVWGTALVIRLRTKEKIPAIETIGFIFSFLIIAAFLRSEGWYRYLFEAQLMSLIFFPLSIRTIFNFATDKTRLEELRLTPTVFVVILALVGLYQLMFSSWVADAYGVRKTAFWREYFSSINESTSVFFYNVPEVVPFINHRYYYQYIVCAAGEFGEDQLIRLLTGKADMVILETAAYNISNPLFRLYKVDVETYKYSVLVKRDSGKTPAKWSSK